MIVSFGDKSTEYLYDGELTKHSRRFPPEIVRTAQRKLDMLNAAHVLDDMRMPPGNRLEALRGNLKEYFSVRVNDQWRIIFRWHNGNALDVSLIDYH